jgi:LacI family transcriptional regulator
VVKGEELKRSTIIDVAQRAGVSISTVSRVVRGRDEVSAATRERVQAVINSLDYRPSPIARALVSGQTKLIALLVSDIRNAFYPQLAMSVEREAAKLGYAVVICNTGDKVRETRRFMERLVAQGLDGVIHASATGQEDGIVELLASPKRIVFVNRASNLNECSAVISGNRQGAAELTRHLLDLGHRSIGFIAGPPYAQNAEERRRGFLEVADGVARTQVFDGDFSAASGAAAVEQWRKDRGLPSAIIGVNDTVAIGLLDAALRHQLRVPEDLAVAGFDNIAVAASELVNLTTVGQPIDRMARRAVKILARQLEGPETFEPVHERLGSVLIVRRSTAGAGAASQKSSARA